MTRRFLVDEEMNEDEFRDACRDRINVAALVKVVEEGAAFRRDDKDKNSYSQGIRNREPSRQKMGDKSWVSEMTRRLPVVEAEDKKVAKLEDNANAESVCRNWGMSDEMGTRERKVLEKERAKLEEDMRYWKRLKKEEDWEEDLLNQMYVEKQQNRYLGRRNSFLIRGRMLDHEFAEMNRRRSESRAGRIFRDNLYSQRQSDRHRSGASMSEKIVAAEGNFDEQDIFFLSLARMTIKLKSEMQGEVLLKLTSFLSNIETLNL